jgi:hypothetical protein
MHRVTGSVTVPDGCASCEVLRATTTVHVSPAVIFGSLTVGAIERDIHELKPNIEHLILSRGENGARQEGL